MADQPPQDELIIPKKKKRPSPPSARFARILLIFLALLVLVLVAVAVYFLDSRDSDRAQINTEESLVVPFDKLQPTLTRYKYHNKVMLIISGTGQAGGKSYSDAFYLYTDEQGEPYPVPAKEAFDLEIDGQRAIITLGLRKNPPPLSSDHIYTVTYDVGATPRQIAFRISDRVVSDNTGEFMIKVFEVSP